jgi:hypothetical protein
MVVKNDYQAELSPLEIQLASTLKPIKPSSAFIQTTRRKFNFASPTLVAKRLSDKHFLLILLASCFGAALFIITGTRALFYLLGRSKSSPNFQD